MAEAPPLRGRVASHRDYLESLRRPTTHEWELITQAQRRKEDEIDGRYRAARTAQEHAAAATIQKAYRSHRGRRQLDGLTIDPSSRWLFLIREMRYRAATVPHTAISPASPARDARRRRRARATSNAKLNWQRAGVIAGRVVEGELTPSGSEDEVARDEDHHHLQSKDAVDTLLLDRRYFLEMVDQKHRYGTNLQVYHEHWLRLGLEQNFFFWLDHGDGRRLDLPGCTRDKLDRERIRYLSRDERRNYLVRVDDGGRLRWHKTDELITTSADFKDSMHGIVPRDDIDAPDFHSEDVRRQLSDERHFASELAMRSDFAIGADPATLESEIDGLAFQDSSDDTDDAPAVTAAASRAPQTTTRTTKRHKPSRLHLSPATVLNHLLRATVRPGTWIYVSDTLGRIYIGIKSSGAFQHTSFLSGARISSAGLIAVESGRLTYLSPLSGHYRPTTQSFRDFITALDAEGADLELMKVSRAYEVLGAMERYTRAKNRVRARSDLRKERRAARAMAEDRDRDRDKDRDRESSGDDDAELVEEKLYRMLDLNSDALRATELVQRNWDADHAGRPGHSHRRRDGIKKVLGRTRGDSSGAKEGES